VGSCAVSVRTLVVLRVGGESCLNAVGTQVAHRPARSTDMTGTEQVSQEMHAERRHLHAHRHPPHHTQHTALHSTHQPTVRMESSCVDAEEEERRVRTAYARWRAALAAYCFSASGPGGLLRSAAPAARAAAMALSCAAVKAAAAYGPKWSSCAEVRQTIAAGQGSGTRRGEECRGERAVVPDGIQTLYCSDCVAA
jgi:hypothetical protein